MWRRLLRVADLLRWAAVEGQLHPWKRGMVLGGLFAVVWGALLFGLGGWVQLHAEDRLGSYLQAMYAQLFGQAGILLGVAACGWVLSRSPHSLWRQVNGWLATYTGLLVGALVVTVTYAAAGVWVRAQLETRLLPSPDDCFESLFDLSLWLVPLALAQLYATRGIGRGVRGVEFRAFALLAGGLVALFHVFPTILTPPYFVKLDLEVSYPVFLNMAHHSLGVSFMEVLGMIAAVLWSTLWLKQGHRWWGWFGVANLGLIASVAAVLLARHLYASPYTDAHADDVPEAVAMLSIALLAAAPFLWVARMGDRATAIPLDHPARDGAAAG